MSIKKTFAASRKIAVFKNHLKKYEIHRNDFDYNNINLTTVEKPGKAYYIPSNKINNFVESYIKLYNVVNKSNLLRFNQISNKIGLYTIDVDLHRKCKNMKIAQSCDVEEHRLLNDDMVDHFVNICIDVFKIYVQTNNIEDPYVFVMKRPEGDNKYTENSYIMKDGLHLIISTLNFKYKNLVKMTTDIITRAHAHNGPFKDYDRKKTIDLGIYGKKLKWMMYGSCKKGGKPYIVNHLIDINTKKHINNVDKYYTSSDLIRKFIIFGKTKCVKILNSPSLKVGMCETINVLGQLTDEHKTNKIINHSITTDFLDILWLKLDALKFERYDDEDKWRDIGWCLKSASDGDSRVMKLFDRFSQKIINTHPEKYNQNSVYNMWDRGRLNTYGWNSLNEWLKEDCSANTYNYIMTKDITNYIIHHVGDWSHMSMAHILNILCGGRYKAMRVSKGNTSRSYVFFEFVEEKHMWMKSTGIPKSLLVLLQTNLYQAFQRARLYYYKKLTSDITLGIATNDRQSQYEKRLKGIDIATKNIGNRAYRTNIIDDCVSLYMSHSEHDTKLLEIFNDNSTLTAYKNGVYDAIKNEFRDGRLNDMISVNMGCNYILNYDINETNDMINSLKKVFKNNNVFMYVIKLIALCVFESKARCKCVMFHGDGGSGKTEFINLINYTLGKYFSSLPMTYFTEKNKQLDKPSPSIMKLMYTRIICSSEANASDNFDMHRFKFLTSGSQLIGRSLFENVVHFWFKALVLMETNELVPLGAIDRSIIRRIIVVNCNSIFSDDVEKDKKTYPHRADRIYQKDDYFSEKVRDWATNGCFGSWLLKIYRTEVRYKNFKLVDMPKSVEIDTKNYINQYNFHGRFYTEHLKMTDSKHDRLSIINISKKYKIWGKKQSIKQRFDPIKFINFLRTNYQPFICKNNLIQHVYKDNYDNGPEDNDI